MAGSYIWDDHLWGWWEYDWDYEEWWFQDMITGRWYSEWDFSPLELPWFVY